MDNKTYQWPQANNDTPMVGRKVQERNPFGNITTVYDHFSGARQHLMLPLYSTVAEWVRESDLTEYIGGRGT